MPVNKLPDRIDEQALAWFLKNNHHLDARSQMAFKAWLAIDPLHEQAYQGWQRDWDSLDTLSKAHLCSLGSTPTPEPFRVLATKVSWWQAGKDAWADFLLTPSTRLLALLGAVCLALGVGGLSVYGRWLDQPEPVEHLEGKPGDQKNHVSPDKSLGPMDTASGK